MLVISSRKQPAKAGESDAAFWAGFLNDEDGDDAFLIPPDPENDNPPANKAWDEAKHPRHKAGSENGGQFAPADGAAGGEFTEFESYLVDSVRDGKIGNVFIDWDVPSDLKTPSGFDLGKFAASRRQAATTVRELLPWSAGVGVGATGEGKYADPRQILNLAKAEGITSYDDLDRIFAEQGVSPSFALLRMAKADGMEIEPRHVIAVSIGESRDVGEDLADKKQIAMLEKATPYELAAAYKRHAEDGNLQHIRSGGVASLYRQSLQRFQADTPGEYVDVLDALTSAGLPFRFHGNTYGDQHPTFLEKFVKTGPNLLQAMYVSHATRSGGAEFIMSEALANAPVDGATWDDIAPYLDEDSLPRYAKDFARLIKNVGLDTLTPAAAVALMEAKGVVVREMEGRDRIESLARLYRETPPNLSSGDSTRVSEDDPTYRQWANATTPPVLFASEDDVVRQKIEIERSLTKATGGQYRTSEIRDFVHQWAVSSNGDDTRSLNIQMAASREFGAVLSSWQQEGFKNANRALLWTPAEKWTPEAGDAEIERMRPVLRAMYESTQDNLKKAGVAYVHAYRGIDPPPRSIYNDLQERDIFGLEDNALSSWSLSPAIARQFGKFVIEAAIPAERILSTARTGFGCLGEEEIVVIGTPEDSFARVHAVPMTGTYTKPLKPKAAASKAWDPEKHPRHPAGSEHGGQFAPADGADEYRPLSPVEMNADEIMMKGDLTVDDLQEWWLFSPSAKKMPVALNFTSKAWLKDFAAKTVAPIVKDAGSVDEALAALAKHAKLNNQFILDDPLFRFEAAQAVGGDWEQVLGKSPNRDDRCRVLSSRISLDERFATMPDAFTFLEKHAVFNDSGGTVRDAFRDSFFASAVLESTDDVRVDELEKHLRGYDGVLRFPYANQLSEPALENLVSTWRSENEGLSPRDAINATIQHARKLDTHVWTQVAVGVMDTYGDELALDDLLALPFPGRLRDEAISSRIINQLLERGVASGKIKNVWQGRASALVPIDTAKRHIRDAETFDEYLAWTRPEFVGTRGASMDDEFRVEPESVLEFAKSEGISDFEGIYQKLAEYGAMPSVDMLVQASKSGMEITPKHAMAAEYIDGYDDGSSAKERVDIRKIRHAATVSDVAAVLNDFDVAKKPRYPNGTDRVTTMVVPLLTMGNAGSVDGIVDLLSEIGSTGVPLKEVFAGVGGRFIRGMTRKLEGEGKGPNLAQALYISAVTRGHDESLDDVVMNAPLDGATWADVEPYSGLFERYYHSEGTVESIIDRLGVEGMSDRMAYAMRGHLPIALISLLDDVSIPLSDVMRREATKRDWIVAQKARNYLNSAPDVATGELVTMGESDGERYEKWLGKTKPSYSTDNDPGKTKDAIVTALAKKTGLGYSTVDEFVRQWAVSSNGGDMRSLNIQVAAAKEFGTELSGWQEGEIGLATQKLLWPNRRGASFDSEVDLMGKVLRSMHTKTQQHLKRAGVSQVRLYRGVKAPSGSPLESANIDDIVRVDDNALSSWSLSPQTAKGFGDYVMTAIVPASQILSTARTGLGCLEEQEVVVIGNKGDAYVMVHQTPKSVFGNPPPPVKRNDAQKAWDPEKHPRHPAGSEQGGRFAPADAYDMAALSEAELWDAPNLTVEQVDKWRTPPGIYRGEERYAKIGGEDAKRYAPLVALDFQDRGKLMDFARKVVERIPIDGDVTPESVRVALNKASQRYPNNALLNDPIFALAVWEKHMASAGGSWAEMAEYDNNDHWWRSDVIATKIALHDQFENLSEVTEFLSKEGIHHPLGLKTGSSAVISAMIQNTRGATFDALVAEYGAEAVGGRLRTSELSSTAFNKLVDDWIEKLDGLTPREAIDRTLKEMKTRLPSWEGIGIGALGRYPDDLTMKDLLSVKYIDALAEKRPFSDIIERTMRNSVAAGTTRNALLATNVLELDGMKDIISGNHFFAKTLDDYLAWGNVVMLDPEKDENYDNGTFAPSAQKILEFAEAEGLTTFEEIYQKMAYRGTIPNYFLLNEARKKGMEILPKHAAVADMGAANFAALDVGVPAEDWPKLSKLASDVTIDDVVSIWNEYGWPDSWLSADPIHLADPIHAALKSTKQETARDFVAPFMTLGNSGIPLARVMGRVPTKEMFDKINDLARQGGVKFNLAEVLYLTEVTGRTLPEALKTASTNGITWSDVAPYSESLSRLYQREAERIVGQLGLSSMPESVAIDLLAPFSINADIVPDLESPIEDATSGDGTMERMVARKARGYYSRFPDVQTGELREYDQGGKAYQDWANLTHPQPGFKSPKANLPDEHSYQKDRIVSALSKSSGLPYEEMNLFIQQWAHSSNGGDMRSLNIQIAAAEEFGTDLSSWQEDSVKDAYGAESLWGRSTEAEEMRDNRSALRSMYKATQKHLSDAGVSHVMVYRGVNLPYGHPAGKSRLGDTVHIEDNALASWSLDPNVARQFGDVVFSAAVPASKVLSTCRTGFGCLNEKEVVVIGNPGAAYARIYSTGNYSHNIGYFNSPNPPAPIDTSEKPTATKTWNEADHPRHPAGTGDGGQFAPAGTGTTTSDESSSSWRPDAYDAPVDVYEAAARGEVRLRDLVQYVKGIKDRFRRFDMSWAGMGYPEEKWTDDERAAVNALRNDPLVQDYLADVRHQRYQDDYKMWPSAVQWLMLDGEPLGGALRAEGIRTFGDLGKFMEETGSSFWDVGSERVFPFLEQPTLEELADFITRTPIAEHTFDDVFYKAAEGRSGDDLLVYFSKVARGSNATVGGRESRPLRALIENAGEITPEQAVQFSLEALGQLDPSDLPPRLEKVFSAWEQDAIDGNTGEVLHWSVDKAASIQEALLPEALDDDGGAKRLKKSIVKALAAGSDVDDTKVNNIIKQWAISSNGADMRSLAIQEEAAKMFGAPLGDWQQEQINKAKTSKNIHRRFPLGTGAYWRASQQELTQREAAARAEISGVMKTMYDNTQAWFKERGITHVRVYRGVAANDIGDIRLGDTIQTQSNALSSWSIEWNTAHDFAWADMSESNAKRKKSNGYMLSTTVPVERILSTPHTGFGCLSEGEVVVIGQQEPTFARVDYIRDYGASIIKQRKAQKA